MSVLFDHKASLVQLTRDLLQLPNDRVVIARENIDRPADYQEDFVVIDSIVKQKQGSSYCFDRIEEKQIYSTYWQATCTVDFYGANATALAYTFDAMLRSQVKNELQKLYNIVLYSVKMISDLKLLESSMYSNREQVELNIAFTTSLEIPTLRIDSFELNTNIE